MTLATFTAPYAPPDAELAPRLLAAARRSEDSTARVATLAGTLVTAIRETAAHAGIEEFLHAYSLSTREGLALMVLAESLLRVPDAETADRLIEDKLAAGDWVHTKPHADALLIFASAWTLSLTARLLHPGETPQTVVEGLLRRVGMPAVRTATRQAMRFLGSHFVLGQTIEEALARARRDPHFRYSFDMLGEGARTAPDAARYFEAYSDAIAAVGQSAGHDPLPRRPGISVKLSALSPHYDALSRSRVMAELVPQFLALAQQARAHDLNLTMDAEEADRLELSLDVFAAVLADPSLAGWDGFGLAVQAYSKRARVVIDWVEAAAHAHDRRLMVRLVKGAYWDMEIKRAQEQGLTDYPVFTRKAATDLCFVACARKLLAARPRLFPQFATHNALTVASIIDDAGGVDGFEFQRLHGMGDGLYAALREAYPEVACRTYAPVGTHRDLLAYLVRRLLENGANTSFAAAIADRDTPLASLLTPPEKILADAKEARDPAIPLPGDLYAPSRRNAAGLAVGDRTALDGFLAAVAAAPQSGDAAPLINGHAMAGRRGVVVSPIDGHTAGHVIEADTTIVDSAVDAARDGFRAWTATPLSERAQLVERASDLIEQDCARLTALLQAEGGKTLEDCIAEVREAVDYCRYYAAEARTTLAPRAMPGPTGESNTLRLRGRGVFVCISPWNFPLAIFTGQIVAALVAGNTVVAKPAEQTPLIAAHVVRLLHDAGIPPQALHLVTGDGRMGSALVADPRIAGVAFTGSTDVARRIAQALAARPGPIVPLIAETGGINAMIVDATALPEQVTDDVLASAFRSAGQRCSALRLLCVQEDVADRVVAMIADAARELVVGDPRHIATQVGPVIDDEARKRLTGWIDGMARHGAVRFRWDAHHKLPQTGFFVPPAIVSLDAVRDLREEVFGPVLHVVRWAADELDRVLDEIDAAGFALTLGVHSRIDATAERIAARLAHGNVYVNRNMIGAVVGTQPFGGSRLSGTGPKAGGPHYLPRFCAEQVVTINTAAIGGNASLLSRPQEPK